MKRILSILAPMGIGIMLTASVFAQSPEKMSYQTVIRNSSDELVTNQDVGIQISILEGSASGTAVYVETQTATSNANGLVSIAIGEGTTEDDFSAIDWSAGPYYLKTETDPQGGTDYTVTGTSQLLSVPYALHSKTAETVTGSITETDPSVPEGTQTGEMQYWDGNEWVTLSPEGYYDGAVLTLSEGMPAWENQMAEGEVENPITGKIWMDRNLGASQVATSDDDVDAYGDLYQWGRAADGHEDRSSTTTTTLADSDTPDHAEFITTDAEPNDWRTTQNDDLWQGVDGTNNPCPEGYRLPTEAEWIAERESWSSRSSFGAFESPLKLPLTGRRKVDGTIVEVGGEALEIGFYWSSTVDGTDARGFYAKSDWAGEAGYARALGKSVRCIKD